MVKLRQDTLLELILSAMEYIADEIMELSYPVHSITKTDTAMTAQIVKQKLIENYGESYLDDSYIKKLVNVSTQGRR